MTDELDVTLLGEPTPAFDEEVVEEEAGLISIDRQDFVEDRYHRLRLIPWWDQKKLRVAKIMVIGAGALGNEILKNLALLGIGKIIVVDFDTIENSNLSRSVLFRAKDEGRAKAEVAAERLREINPDIKVQPFTSNIVYDIGLGVFREMDVVIGGLDNREARLAINQACWKVSTPYIDGAIEVLHGVARVFVPPDSACYECTMNEQDFQLLNMRKSCALLTRDEMIQGKVPTTPTVSSVIAGIQVQEAVKLIHRRPSIPPLVGKGFHYNGQTFDCYLVEYERKEDCLSHETFENIIEIDDGVDTVTLKDMLARVRRDLGGDAVLEFDKEIVYRLTCTKCRTSESIFKQLGKVTESEGRCPQCGEMRDPEMTHSIAGHEEFLDMTLAALGIPPYDIVTGRRGLEMIHYLLRQDREQALGAVV